MYRFIIITILLLLLAGVLMAQETPDEEVEEISLEELVAAISDSLLQQREQEIREEFGYSNRDKLADVAEILGVGPEDMAKWKTYLKLEPGNEALNSMTLLNLGITPYQALLATQYVDYGFTELSTFAEISERKSMPIKIMREKLGLSSQDKTHDNSSLQALKIRPAAVDSLITRFKNNALPYGLSLTLVGMTITFAALLITSIVVNQLQMVNRNPKAKKEEAVTATDSKSKPVAVKRMHDRNAVAAAIMALHIYETGIKEKKKQMLTFKRTPTNQWRASQVLEMPNRQLFRSRR